MKRICIFAPHQDDEILACTYLIKKALIEVNEITIVFLTTGDFMGRDTAKIRMSESVSALKQLGIPIEQIIQFGYANTGMKIRKCLLYKFYKTSHEQKLISTPHAFETYHPNGGETFHYKLYHKEAYYTAENFKSDVENFLKMLRPDIIYITSDFDKHGDHRAAFLIVRDVLISLKKEYKYMPEIYSFLIHTLGNWPNKKGGHYKKPLFMSKERWQTRVSINAKSEDVELKKRIIDCFESQKDSMNFLLSFTKQEEIFWKESYLERL